MKFEEKNYTIQVCIVSSIQGFHLLVSSPGIGVAASLSAEAQIVPRPPCSTPTAPPIQGFDSAPQVTTDGAGNWVAVWSSDENLGGTAGTDYDIFGDSFDEPVELGIGKF